MHLGNLTEQTPAVNFADRYQAVAGDHWGPRQIPDYQFFYVVSGEAELSMGGQNWRIRDGECVHYGPEHPHKLSVTRETDYISLHFAWHAESSVPVHPAHEIRDIQEHAMHTEEERYTIGIPDHGTVAVPVHFPAAGVESIMMRIVKKYREEQPGSPYILRALLMELLMTLIAQWMKVPDGRSVNKVEPALNVIRENPAAGWSIKQLAGLCGYHPSYFTRVFSNETGYNPKEYVIRQRIALAKQALLRGDSAEAIAKRLGYESIHYFSANFKKVTGLSPSDYKQSPDQSRTHH